MSTVSKTFSAVDIFSNPLLLVKGQSATFAITGTFVATLLLQRSPDGGQTWETVLSFTGTASSTVIQPQDREGRYRFYCSDYTSGSPAITLADATDTLYQIQNKDGTVVFRVTEAGIETPAIAATAAGAVEATTIHASGAITGDTTLAVGANTDTAHVLGQVKLGFLGVGWEGIAVFAHRAKMTATEFALYHNASGNTVLNGLASIQFDIGGTAVVDLAASSLTIRDGATLRLASIENSLTAHAGGTQAAALALTATKSVHRISICATNGDSVKLPTVAVGEEHLVINSGAASLQVFGSGTATIDDVATATGVAIPAGKSARFIGVVAGAAGSWYMNLGA